MNEAKGICLSVAIATLLILSFQVNDFISDERVISDVRHSAVCVSGEYEDPLRGKASGFGSGTMFEYGKSWYVLTCAHIVPTPDTKLSVKQRVRTADAEGIDQEFVSRAEVVKIDPARDLCLLRLIDDIGTVDIPNNKVRKRSVRIGETVYHSGTYYNKEHCNDMLFRGHTAKHGKSHDTAEVSIIQGCSGGGLFDSKGRYIGVITGVTGVVPQGTVCHYVPSRVVYEWAVEVGITHILFKE